MRAILLPTASLLVTLALAGCTDAGAPTVTPPSPSPAHDRPYLKVDMQIPRRPGDLYLILTSTGPSGGTAGFIVQRGEESADLDLVVGDPATALGHTFELLGVERDSATLAVTDPSGDQLGYDPRTDG